MGGRADHSVRPCKVRRPPIGPVAPVGGYCQLLRGGLLAGWAQQFSFRRASLCRCAALARRAAQCHVPPDHRRASGAALRTALSAACSRGSLLTGPCSPSTPATHSTAAAARPAGPGAAQPGPAASRPPRWMAGSPPQPSGNRAASVSSAPRRLEILKVRPQGTGWLTRKTGSPYSCRSLGEMAIKRHISPVLVAVV